LTLLVVAGQCICFSVTKTNNEKRDEKLRIFTLNREIQKVEGVFHTGNNQ
jgi:hypothetical protein